MGIATSRQSLIDSIQRIPDSQHKLQLDVGLLADMLFGAVIGKLLIDALMGAQNTVIDLLSIQQKIELVVNAMFQANE